MKKTKKLLAVFAAVSVALMLPLQTMAAVDLNAKYDISTNQIQGWPVRNEGVHNGTHCRYPFRGDISEALCVPGYHVP